MDGNRIAEYLYDDVAGTSTLIREYIWLEGTPVAVYENEVMYYIRTDHIGRPVFATDDAGTVVWEASYLPFGGVHTSSGTPINLRFPGQWFQSESGLHQNWMRDYDPTTGRYVQADPLGLVDGASVYGYALQNPMYWTDPTGEIACGGVCIAAISYVGWMVLDYLLDDGCYTWEDFWWSAITNLDPTRIGKAVARMQKAGKLPKKKRNQPPAPLNEAEGRPHSIIERPGRDGQYTTHHGDGTYTQYRGSGTDHGGIPRPNIKETGTNVAPGGRTFPSKPSVRPPRPDEIPRR